MLNFFVPSFCPCLYIRVTWNSKCLTQIHRRMDRQTCGHLDTDRPKKFWADRPTNIWTDRLANIWTLACPQTSGHRQIYRLTDKHRPHRHLDTDPQTSRHREAHELLGKQTRKHLDRQAHIPFDVDRPMTYGNGQLCKHLATGRPTSI